MIVNKRIVLFTAPSVILFILIILTVNRLQQFVITLNLTPLIIRVVSK